MSKKPDPTIVELLRRAGHCTAKAIEIALDYARGDRHARAWVSALTLMSGGSL